MAQEKAGLALCERVLGFAGLADTPHGRLSYRATMEKRVLEMQHSSEPWKVDEAWHKIRRGGCFGDDTFRKAMLERLDGSLESVRRDSVSGDEVAMHDEAEAERLVCLGMSALNLEEDDLSHMIKSAPSKYAIAWLVRRNTSVRTRWIKDRLRMRSATNFSDYLRRIETAKKANGAMRNSAESRVSSCTIFDPMILTCWRRWWRIFPAMRFSTIWRRGLFRAN